jgi:hypothetical protein
MENENIIDSGTSYPNNQLIVSPLASGYLNETGKWSKFLAILGFCFIGLIVVAGLFAGTIFSAMNSELPYPGFMMGVIYIVMGLLYFFPMYYLFKFSTQVRAALMRKDSRELDSAFENLKSHYKYIGIFMIITLGFYVLFGGGVLLTAAFM